MIDPNLGYLFEYSLDAINSNSSDSSYVLRKMLYRGGREAELRSFLCNGEKAQGYKQLMVDLESIAENLDDYTAENKIISLEYRNAIIIAVNMCRILLAIDQAEIQADYNHLISYLTDDLCETCKNANLAA